ncbi:MAG: hypothetical protein KF802_01915 [Bdellovibrionaceae bacterium]|nr:hypothetical protein [Pseudobdellovibrionaceae bacterium]MBX3033927.1 hypothetical protein [Pseudobdellovibrionaceae bacterium]
MAKIMSFPSTRRLFALGLTSSLLALPGMALAQEGPTPAQLQEQANRLARLIESRVKSLDRDIVTFSYYYGREETESRINTLAIEGRLT